MPSQINSSSLTRPSIDTRIFAACRVSRSIDTSLNASAVLVLPPAVLTFILSGWIACASVMSSRASRSLGE